MTHLTKHETSFEKNQSTIAGLDHKPTDLSQRRTQGIDSRTIARHHDGYFSFSMSPCYSSRHPTTPPVLKHGYTLVYLLLLPYLLVR